VDGRVLPETSNAEQYGKLSDIYGRKRLLLVSYIFFAIGWLVPGRQLKDRIMIPAQCTVWSSSINDDCSRRKSGIGYWGSGSPGARVIDPTRYVPTLGAIRLLISPDLFPLREVASIRSYVNIVATTGRSLGGPIGGALADTVGWRWQVHQAAD
jgi:MFS family permease